MITEEWAMTETGYKVSFWGDENVLKLIVLMVSLFCEYTQNTELHTLSV